MHYNLFTIPILGKSCAAPEIENTILDPLCGPYLYEDLLMVTCKTGYELADGSDSYACQSLDTGMLNCTESCTGE